jgi:putative transposon-encoded protein
VVRRGTGYPVKEERIQQNYWGEHFWERGGVHERVFVLPVLWLRLAPAMVEVRVKVMEKGRQESSKRGSIQQRTGQWRTIMRDTGNRKEQRAQEKPFFQEELRPLLPKVKFEVYGEEMLEKEVKYSGNSGRVYLPPEWVGKHIKVIRTN